MSLQEIVAFACALTADLSDRTADPPADDDGVSVAAGQAMIMDGLETLSAASFAEAHASFHLLSFDAFKSELAGRDGGADACDRRVQRMDDSLNTPISSFMDLPVFFSGPSVVSPPATGKRSRATL